MDGNHNRNARRSATDLSHLSLGPLTAKFPVGDEEDLSSQNPHRISYIEGRSTPSTPGILSRSPSGTRLYSHGNPTNMPASPSILRSKSAVQLLKLQNQRSMSGRTPSTSTSSEWLLRAGQAISSETRESKGQSWLVSRASSTSLVDRVEDEGEIGGWAADDEYSRAHSRIGSRFASRRGSTQGSREFVTPRENRLSRDGYFDLDMTTEPDFVDEEEIERRYLEEVLDEAEISQLTRQRGFGLGRWMDRLVGWSLFAVEEQDDESGAPHESTSTRLEENVRRKRREEGERIVLAERPPPAPEGRPGEGQAAGEGGWQDAAWLLSVASKVIL